MRNQGKRRESQRVSTQQMIARILVEASAATDVGSLEKVFGSASPERALRMALRIKHLKKREDDLFSGETVGIHAVFPGTLNGRKSHERRNVHHLTPKCRKDQPFSGNNIHNFLLMKVSRHDALHKEFGVRTWEEIIVLLSRCVATIRRMDFSHMVDLIQGAFKRTERQKARRALRNLQLGFCPGAIRGSPLPMLSGCRELNPVYLLPKQAYYRYTTSRIISFYLQLL